MENFLKFQVSLINQHLLIHACMTVSRKIVDTPSPNSHWKQWKNIYLTLDLPNWCNFCWYIVLLAIHQDLICQSWYSILNPTACFHAKVSFSNTLLISETFHLTTETSIALCWPIYLKTLNVFSLGFYTWRHTLQVIRKNFPGTISPQPQECWARLVTVTNEPFRRPSTSSFTFSQAKKFFFSTSWKCQRLPIWLKTLNPKGYAGKYWYRKSLDVVRYP